MKYTLQQIIDGFTNQPANSTWLTVKEVCRYTKLSPSTIFRLTQKGVLKVSKKTGINLYRKEWVDRFFWVQNEDTCQIYQSILLNAKVVRQRRFVPTIVHYMATGWAKDQVRRHWLPLINILKKIVR